MEAVLFFVAAAQKTSQSRHSLSRSQNARRLEFLSGTLHHRQRSVHRKTRGTEHWAGRSERFFLGPPARGRSGGAPY